MHGTLVVGARIAGTHCLEAVRECRVGCADMQLICSGCLKHWFSKVLAAQAKAQLKASRTYYCSITHISLARVLENHVCREQAGLQSDHCGQKQSCPVGCAMLLLYLLHLAAPAAIQRTPRNHHGMLTFLGSEIWGANTQ